MCSHIFPPKYSIPSSPNTYADKITTLEPIYEETDETDSITKPINNNNHVIYSDTIDHVGNTRDSHNTQDNPVFEEDDAEPTPHSESPLEVVSSGGYGDDQPEVVGGHFESPQHEATENNDVSSDIEQVSEDMLGPENNDYRPEPSYEEPVPAAPDSENGSHDTEQSHDDVPLVGDTGGDGDEDNPYEEPISSPPPPPPPPALPDWA